ncbi:hypothetical protein FOZ63_006656, partial [Perkinsus olseni]
AYGGQLSFWESKFAPTPSPLRKRSGANRLVVPWANRSSFHWTALPSAITLVIVSALRLARLESDVAATSSLKGVGICTMSTRPTGKAPSRSACRTRRTLIVTVSRIPRCTAIAAAE